MKKMHKFKNTLPWKTLTSKRVYANHWITVREDSVIRPDGAKGIYGVVETKPSVTIVPIADRHHLYLIQLYRYPTHVFSWEIPSGGMNRGESHRHAVRRELQEETGFTARHIESLGRFQVWNGVSNEWSFLFLAEKLSKTHKYDFQEEGIIEMKKFSFRTALSMIGRGIITDSFTILGVLRTAIKLKILKTNL